VKNVCKHLSSCAISLLLGLNRWDMAVLTALQFFVHQSTKPGICLRSSENFCHTPASIFDDIFTAVLQLVNAGSECSNKKAFLDLVSQSANAIFFSDVDGDDYVKKCMPSRTNVSSNVSTFMKATEIIQFQTKKQLNSISIGLLTELAKQNLLRALICRDTGSDSIYCLANVYLAVLYYTTGQYQRAIDHCICW